VRLLVTGGAGFIGSHLVDALLAEPSRRVTVLDRLSIGGSRMNLESHRDDARLTFLHADVIDPDAVGRAVEATDTVIHAAAETHVDRSIDAARGFLETNVLGTQTILEAVRRYDRRLLMVSTDEVYGPGDPEGGLFEEDHALAPRSPYAASKAAADLLCQAYVATYGANVTLVRGTNAFGPRQIERVVPTYAIDALEGRPVPVYGEGRQRREFLFVEDWVRAALTVLERGERGVVYNIGMGFELENLDLARRICALAGAGEDQIAFVPDRPGHDFRYGVASERLAALGWRPVTKFDDALKVTVDWYRDHLDWLRRAHPGEIVTSPRAVGTGS
jgi:dTDP-glucose 4,6-dehydratase